MNAARLLGLMSCLLWSGAAPAQPAPPAPQGPVSGADQVVGLFGATCLQYAGNVAGLRGFLAQQKAPEMPPQARDAFLAGRAGKAFDVSYQTVKLALVSFDDGGCEAVADQANPQEVLSTLQEAAQANQVVLTPLGAQPDKQHAGVQHEAFSVNAGGKTMHVLVSTAPAPPQAVLTLAPR
jgi:hypothetical protein